MSPIEAWNYLAEVARDFGEVARDFILSLWKLPVVNSVLGLFFLLLLYGALYWLFLVVTRTYFIEIAPFRIWRDPVPAYLSEGMASRLVDELLRLQQDVREHGRAAGSSRSGLRFHRVRFLPPVAAQVTIEFKGISPEALNAFLRRLCRRHVLITCDLIDLGSSLRLLGRSARAGPWEMEFPRFQGTGLFRKALQEFAVRAVGDVQPASCKALANALAYKQWEAYIDKDHAEALRLAKLGLVVMPEDAVQFFNLGSAHQESVAETDDYDQRSRKIELAIAAYREAIEVDESFSSAYADLGIAQTRLGVWKLARGDSDGGKESFELAEDNLRQAVKLDPEDAKSNEALSRLRHQFGELG